MKLAGYTLIELLTTLSVAGILGGLVLPSSVSMVQKYRLRTAAWDLFHSINTARASAIMRDRRVTLSAPSGDWHDGAEIFVDGNASGERDTGEELLRQVPAHQGVVIEGNYWVKEYISFTPDGSARAISGAFQIGTVTICHPELSNSYGLVISVGGRVRLTSSDKPCPG